MVFVFVAINNGAITAAGGQGWVRRSKEGGSNGVAAHFSRFTAKFGLTRFANRANVPKVLVRVPQEKKSEGRGTGRGWMKKQQLTCAKGCLPLI